MTLLLLLFGFLIYPIREFYGFRHKDFPSLLIQPFAWLLVVMTTRMMSNEITISPLTRKNLEREKDIGVRNYYNWKIL